MTDANAIEPVTEETERAIPIAEAAVLVPVGQEPRFRRTDVKPETAAEAPRTEPSLTLEAVRADAEVQAFIRQANKNLGVLGYTEHGFRHVGLVSSIARNVLRLLEYDARQQELAAIAGY